METGNFISLNLGKYDEPEYDESPNSRGWIDYGKDNLFPQYLIGLYNSSAVHSALVNSIGQMIYGGGLTSENSQAKFAIAALGLDEAIQRASIDLKLQGGFYLEVKWNLDRTKINKVRHIPFEEVRSGHMNNRGNVPFYYHSLDWENTRQNEVTPIRSYSPDAKNDHPVQLMACFPFTVGSKYYPKPDYMGALNWIEVDKQVSIFHNNNIANGMAPSFAINWKNGTPNLEKRNEMRRDIENQLSGASNAGKFFMTFSDDADSAPDFEPMALSDAHNQYQFVSTESTDKIMIGHRVTSPALFGVKTAGQLGGTDELKTASKLFQANVIEPMQNVITGCVDTILTENGISSNVTIESINPLLPQDEANNEQSFTGIQISSAIDTITKVKTGELEENQAIQILVSMLGFSREDAEGMFEKVLGAELSAQDPRPNMDEATEATWIKWLETKGEKVDEDEYELIEVSDVEDGEHEHELNASMNVKFFERFADPGAKSEIDTGLYKIRYRYSQNLSDDSRLFCRNMVANSKGGTVYKYEDIQSMDGEVNTEFAPQGESSYSIFLYKGGAYCHHKWQRLVYFRKRDGGKFKPNDGLNNDKRVSKNAIDDKAPRESVATTPTDKLPNRGSLKNKG